MKENKHVLIGMEAGRYGKNSIYLGEWAADIKNEDYQFVFTTKLGYKENTYNKFQTTMTDEEYGVISRVLHRAIANQNEFEIPVFIGHNA